ncbi:MAG: aminotransferase class III-fold pyridoxal phosphate-dependent enzyme, partial [Synergistaceae bacterium]|nr:aminotransferase class III-fold pyridoxal phosphate-dependent enzyme [Synergistaceae bacterium]
MSRRGGILPPLTDTNGKLSPRSSKKSRPRTRRSSRYTQGLFQTGAAFGTRQIDEGLGELASILHPELERAVFLNSGSEAVELALKMAHAATGKTGVVVAEKGYYGGTVYALSLSEA